ncbi:transposase [Planctomycetota bacterium]
MDLGVLSKLLLLKYMYNIDSERQLMRDVKVNLAYRRNQGYDLGEVIPDHCVLSKALKLLGFDFF